MIHVLLDRANYAHQFFYVDSAAGRFYSAVAGKHCLRRNARVSHVFDGMGKTGGIGQVVGSFFHIFRID